MRRHHSPPERDRELLIGLDADLSMGGTHLGLAIKRGMLLAMDEINDRGGVLGRPLTLIARDNRGMPSRGVNHVRDFASLDNLVAVMGGFDSATVNAEVPVAQAGGVPFLIPGATSAKITDHGRGPNVVFRLAANDDRAGPYLVEQALKRSDRVALLLENTIWGRGNEAAMGRHLREKGLKPVHVQWFNRGETDFVRHLIPIERSGAGVILLVASPREERWIIRNLAQRAEPLPVVSHWGVGGGRFWRQNRHLLHRVDLTFLQTAFLKPGGGQRYRRLLQRYRHRFDPEGKTGMIFPMATVHAYDLVRLLARAIEQAGDSDRQKVRAALEHPRAALDGVLKRYDPAFTPDRHEALTVADYRLARFGADGAIVLLDGD